VRYAAGRRVVMEAVRPTNIRLTLAALALLIALALVCHELDRGDHERPHARPERMRRTGRGRDEGRGKQQKQSKEKRFRALFLLLATG
jgi:hypothetical protein